MGKTLGRAGTMALMKDFPERKRWDMHAGKVGRIYGMRFLIGVLLVGCWGCGEPRLEKILVTPEKKTLIVGETISVKAVGLSGKGEEMPDVNFQWDIDGDSGSIDKFGRFTAEKPGEAVVIAIANGLRGKATVMIKPMPAAKVAPPPQAAHSPTAGNAAIFPDVILIDNQGFKIRKKGPVKLDHKAHHEAYKVACTGCHHDYQNGRNVWSKEKPAENCISCHHPEKKQGEADKLQNAYHENCRTCHKKLVKENKSEIAPYKKCSDCHQKKS